MKIAVVTGASSGMGREFVRQIAERYSPDEIWAVGRSGQKLSQLQKSVPAGLRLFALDLQRRESIEELCRALKEYKPHIRLLAVCAGMGKTGNFSDLPIDSHLDCVQINCEALTAVTYVCLPYMSRGAQIIHMASASAFVPQPGFAVYAASKAYVLSFSRGLREELRGRGITVTAVCPGAVDTPFFENQAYPAPEYKKKVMARPEAVVKKALRDAGAGRSISIYGAPINAFRYLCMILPQGIIIRAAALLNSKGE